MSILEKSDLNLTVSKTSADAVSAAFSAIYSKLKKISGAAAANLASVFGVESPDKGFPDLLEDETFIKYLFKPYVTPWAVGNWSAGLPPTNIAEWFAYITLEMVLLAMEIKEDVEEKKKLQGYLFADKDPNSSLNAVQQKYLDQCSKVLEATKKANPITQSDLFTSGEEYMLPDGYDYVGEYHVHKDVIFKTGPDHPEDGQAAIVLEKIIKEE